MRSGINQTLAIRSSGKIRLLQHEPDKKVLFEVTVETTNNKYSTA